MATLPLRVLLVGEDALARAGLRAPSGGRLERYLETDLALHPGFSGSLLLGVDGCGRVGHRRCR